MLDEIRGAEQPFFLAGEVREDDRATRRSGGEQTRELEHGGGARRVVVGAATNGAFRVGIERAFGRRAEVIEVRADHDVLAAQRGIAAGQESRTRSASAAKDALRRVRGWSRDEMLEITGADACNPSAA